MDTVAALEKLGWIPFMLAVPEYNKLMLKGKVDEVKSILAKFTFPYSRRIAGEHTHFATKDYKKWLREATPESSKYLPNSNRCCWPYLTITKECLVM